VREGKRRGEGEERRGREGGEDVPEILEVTLLYPSPWPPKNYRK
jgi:hypothetical protein